MLILDLAKCKVFVGGDTQSHQNQFERIGQSHLEQPESGGVPLKGLVSMAWWWLILSALGLLLSLGPTWARHGFCEGFVGLSCEDRALLPL